jgi:hemoglobin
MSEESLYTRLGGEEALSVVVDRFYDRVLDDKNLRPYFDDVSMEELREHQKEFLAAVTGGPVEWDGRDMERAHSHLDIASEDFDRVAGHLQTTLSELDVPEEEADEVMETVARLKPKITLTESDT